MNITQRLLLTFSLLSLALIALVVITLSLLSGFQSRADYVQDNAVASIKDLNNAVDKSNSLVLFFYRYQTTPDSSKLPSIEQSINQTIEDIKSLNDYYMKNDISSEEDKTLTLASMDNVKKIAVGVTGLFWQRQNPIRKISLWVCCKAMGESVKPCATSSAPTVNSSI
ncbi:hypothetical protein DaDZ19_08200 [Dickeya ananatis]